MYVYYDLIDGRRPHFCCGTEYEPDTQEHPSECMWMVPGTVDPMED